MTIAKDEPVLLEKDGVCYVSGRWNVAALSVRGEVARLRRALGAVREATRWQIDEHTLLDSVGAQLLWDRWGKKIPSDLSLTAGQKDLFRMLAQGGSQSDLPKPARDMFAWLEALGRGLGVAFEHGVMLLSLLGRLAFDLLGLMARPHRGPWKEISAQVFRAGAQALGITALVGFLIGVVLSYLSAQQLAMFGAGQFIVTLLGVSIVRELGTCAGSDSGRGSFPALRVTAQIGVMRVTQELDAMDVMGISQSQAPDFADVYWRWRSSCRCWCFGQTR